MVESFSQAEGTAALFKRVCAPLAAWNKLSTPLNQDILARIKRAQSNGPDARLWGTPQETGWYACTITPSFHKRIPDLDKALADIHAKFKTQGTGGIENLVILKRQSLRSWDVTFLLPVKALEHGPSRTGINRSKLAALYEAVTGEQVEIPQLVVTAGETNKKITAAKSTANASASKGY